MTLRCHAGALLILRGESSPWSDQDLDMGMYQRDPRLEDLLEPCLHALDAWGCLK